VKAFIEATQAEGGDDEPEDLQGGLKLSLLQDWTEEATKRVFIIADAPCHGKQYHTCRDDYPAGSPDGLVLEDLMKEFCKKDIEFQFMKLTHNCEKMIEVMKACHQEVEVTDMTNISVSQSSKVGSRGMPEGRSFKSGRMALTSIAPMARIKKSAMMDSSEYYMNDGLMIGSASMSKIASKGSFIKKAAPKKSGGLMSMLSFSKKAGAAPVEKASKKKNLKAAMMPKKKIMADMMDNCADEDDFVKSDLDMMAMPKLRAIDSCKMGMAMATEEPKDVFLEEFVKGTVKQVSKRQAAVRSKKAAM